MSSPDLLLIETYEQHLSDLLATYKQVHVRYLNSIRLKNSEESKNLLLQLSTINQEIKNYSDEIRSKVTKMNKPNAKYQDTIRTKQKDLEALSLEMKEDERKINDLLESLGNANGKNESLHLQIKSSHYYNTFYLIIIIGLAMLITRYFISAETDAAETIVLLIAIVLILYQFRGSVMGLFSSTANYVSNTSYSTLVRFLD